MEDKLPARSLIKEQLYERNRFLDFCQFDEYRGRKIEKTISEEFLDACEKEGFILPLHTEKNNKGESKEKEGLIRYYSPFQIYLISALTNNVPNDEGMLWDGGEMWGENAKEKPRYIDWAGWSSFHVDSYKNNFEPEQVGTNHFRHAEDFHNFLKLLHTFKETTDYPQRDENRSRYFQGLPILQYDFTPLINKEITIDNFNLDENKLKALLKAIGYYANYIDPVGNWFYYIQHHPQWRRDKMKGKATIAQDLYGLCVLLTEIIEIVSPEKLPPFLEIIHPDTKPLGVEFNELAGGTDLQAIKVAYKKLFEWIGSNQKLLDEALELSWDGKILKDELPKFFETEKELEDYEKRYGDKRYTGGMRILVPEEKLTLDDLDQKTRKSIEQIMAQHKNTKVIKGVTHFTTSFEDISERLDKKQINLTDAVKEDNERELKTEITHMIESRLDDLARQVSYPANHISHILWPVTHKIEREKEQAQNEAWRDFEKNVDPSNPNKEKNRVLFWKKDMKQILKPFEQKLSEIRLRQKELGEISGYTRLVLCAVCRKNVVKMHHGQNDRRVSNEAVCDKCFVSVTDKALHATEDEWKDVKYAEWKCDCGKKTLYKFALGNTVSLWSRDKVPVKLELEYGRLALEAKCTKCGRINRRAVDWGWQA